MTLKPIIQTVEKTSAQNPLLGLFEELDLVFTVVIVGYHVTIVAIGQRVLKTFWPLW